MTSCISNLSTIMSHLLGLVTSTEHYSVHPPIPFWHIPFVDGSPSACPSPCSESLATFSSHGWWNQYSATIRKCCAEWVLPTTRAMFPLERLEIPLGIPQKLIRITRRVAAYVLGTGAVPICLMHTRLKEEILPASWFWLRQVYRSWRRPAPL